MEYRRACLTVHCAYFPLLSSLRPCIRLLTISLTVCQAVLARPVPEATPLSLTPRSIIAVTLFSLLSQCNQSNNLNQSYIHHHSHIIVGGEGLSWPDCFHSVSSLYLFTSNSFIEHSLVFKADQFYFWSDHLLIKYFHHYQILFAQSLYSVVRLTRLTFKVSLSQLSIIAIPRLICPATLLLPNIYIDQFYFWSPDCLDAI